MDNRELNIKTQGYLKSIIESGQFKIEEWEETLKITLRIHGRVMKWQKEALAKQRQGTK